MRVGSVEPVKLVPSAESEKAFNSLLRQLRDLDPANFVPSADPGGSERFGYIWIKRFSDGGSKLGRADRIVAEFQRILELMDQVAPDGLILDIRRNPGGDVEAAERMLQMLSPREIFPAKFHLANTPAVLSILRKLNELQQNRSGLSEDEKDKLTETLAALGPWLGDAGNTPWPQGQRVTSGQTLTSHADANQIGQVYQGPVVLLIDALTYSAAEVFGSGFQDHAIGTVIGADLTSGGGGGNVWSHQELLDKLGPMTDLKLEELPAGVTMSLALRRYSRGGSFNGVWVEDVGIKVDTPYVPRSASDLLSGNSGFLQLACDALTHAVKYRVDVTKFALLRDGGVKLEVATVNLDSLSFFLDGHPVKADQSLARGEENVVTTQSFTLDAAPDNGSPDLLRIQGFALAPGASGMERSLRAVRSVALKSLSEEDLSSLLGGVGSNPGGLGNPFGPS